ncbi:MAG: SAM-dependent chlorinase/fluorinase [Actinomycetota bacterium]|nr:SAM-dependent chlorinase/fluorinase [Actinomycetota bacterium]
MPPFITFLTDFGLKDPFVGTCHGVIKRLAPEAEILDITHGIPPQEVLQGALVLANALRYMPKAINLAVVDPGVGGSRRALALRTRDGDYFVGPDNGLLVPAADRTGGIEAVRELTNRRYALEHVSPTFHGRDLFAPAAAHLALGVPLEELGDPVDPGALTRLELPRPELTDGRIRATVLYVDRFGNVQLNVRRAHAERARIEPGMRVELELGGERYYAIATRTFTEAKPGDIVLYEDSYENIAVAINRGSAAEMFGAAPGQEVVIEFDT